MKYLIILNVIFFCVICCQNNKSNNIEKVTKEVTKYPIKPLSDKDFIKYEVADVDEDKKNDSVFISKKEKDAAIEFKIKFNNGIEVKNNNLLTGGDYYSSEQLKDYVFLTVRKDTISLDESIGINDRLQYHLYFDKKTKAILIRDVIYYFVSVHTRSYEDTLVKNKRLEGFKIEDYYPKKK